MALDQVEYCLLAPVHNFKSIVSIGIVMRKARPTFGEFSQVSLNLNVLASRFNRREASGLPTNVLLARLYQGGPFLLGTISDFCRSPMDDV